MRRRNTLTRFGAALATAALAAALSLPAQANQLSRATYDQLNAARDLMDAGKHQQALSKLHALFDEVGNREYERAITLQTIGYAQMGMDDDRAAIETFERVLAMDALPDDPRLRLRNLLARLYARTDQFDKAKQELDAWFSEIQSPSADDYALKANILVELGQHREGIAAIRQAIAMTDEPNEQYFQILTALLFNSEQYAEAAKVLDRMVAMWPEKKMYWNQLSAVHINLGQNEKAHRVLRLAYHKGLLERENELVRLAQVALSIDVPAQAAELLEREIERGRVADDEDNWELVGHAWARAREWDQAISAYDRAAGHGNPGKYHMRRARLYTYLDDWEGTIRAAQQALEAGEAEAAGEAWILIGRGRLDKDDFDAAIAAFEKAQEFSGTASQAKHWTQYAERRRGETTAGRGDGDTTSS